MGFKVARPIKWQPFSPRILSFEFHRAQTARLEFARPNRLDHPTGGPLYVVAVPNDAFRGSSPSYERRKISRRIQEQRTKSSLGTSTKNANHSRHATCPKGRAHSHNNLGAVAGRPAAQSLVAGR